jgi:hypothetical protein
VLHDPSLTWKNGEEKYKVSTEEEDPGTELTNWLKKRQSILANNQTMVYDIVVRRNLTEDAEDIVKLSKAKDFKFSKTKRAEIVKGVSLPENTYYIIANNTLYVYQPDKISDTRAEKIYNSLIHFNLPVDTSKLDPDDLTVTSAPAARKSVSETVYFTEKPTENSISIDYKGRIVTIGNKEFSFSELEKNRQQVIDAIKELTYVIPENPEAIALKVRGKIVASTNNDFTYAVLRQLGSNNNQPGGRGTRARNRKANQATSQAAQQATQQAAQQGLQQSSLSQSEFEAKKADIERRREEELKRFEKRRANYVVKFNPNGENTELTEDEIQEVENLINFAKERGLDAYRTQRLLQTNGYVYSVDNTATAFREFLKARLSGEINTRVNDELLSEIIAKYDAELRALEEQYKTKKQQTTPQSAEQTTQQPAQGKSQPSNTIEPGRYVKYKGETYIVTKINENGTIQIYNPEKEGTGSKKSVSKNNLTPTDALADIVEYKDKKYIVTPKNTIISLTTNKKMNWGENNEDRKAILKLRDEKNKKDESKAEAVQIEEGKQEPSQQPSSKATLGAKLLAPDILTQKELEDKNLVEIFELEDSESKEDVENFFQVGMEKPMDLFSDKISDSEFARKINNKGPEEKLDIISLKAAINNGLGIREGINEFFGKITYYSPVIYKFKFSYSEQRGIKIEDKSVSYISIKDDTLKNSLKNRLSSYLKNIEEFNKQVNEDGYFVLLGAYGHEDAANSFSSEATKELIDSKKIKFIDTENGKECNSPGGPAPQAAAGMAIGGITLGGEWEIVKEFVGPSHAKGGINITVGASGVRITKEDGSEFEAKYGLVILASEFEQ